MVDGGPLLANRQGGGQGLNEASPPNLIFLPVCRVVGFFLSNVLAARGVFHPRSNLILLISAIECI